MVAIAPLNNQPDRLSPPSTSYLSQSGQCLVRVVTWLDLFCSKHTLSPLIAFFRFGSDSAQGEEIPAKPPTFIASPSSARLATDRQLS
jgi:hypothetical protein